MVGELSRRIYERAHLRGEFRLRSGAVSHEYFDKYRFEAEPRLLREIAQGMAVLLPAECDALAGLELGGVPIATVLSQLTGIPTLFVRKEPKAYGTLQIAEGGPVSGQRLVVVEDVVTSAGQIIDSCARLRALGADISVAVCVIDREAGGRENLAREAIELRSLLTVSDLRAAAESI